VNSVIQGSASDVIKLAMIGIHRHLEEDHHNHYLSERRGGGSGGSSAAAAAASQEEGGRSEDEHMPTASPPPPPPPRMLLQVHDELIFDVAANAAAIGKLVGVIRDCMELAVVRELGIRVPLAVKICVGPTWGKMHPIKRQQQSQQQQSQQQSQQQPQRLGQEQPPTQHEQNCRSFQPLLVSSQTALPPKPPTTSPFFNFQKSKLPNQEGTQQMGGGDDSSDDISSQ
jgi:hypothetical protein